MMKIEINKRQNLHRINSRKIKTLCRKILDRARYLNPQRQWNEISIVLVDDPGITLANVAYFGKHNTTDVITTRFNPMPGKDGHSGEIIVNVQCAFREGSTRKHSNPSGELALYIAHGFDHLYDQSDAGKQKRNTMRRRELRWLREIRGPHGKREQKRKQDTVPLDDLFR